MPAALTIYPRYSADHLAPCIPLLAVACGVAARTSDRRAGRLVRLAVIGVGMLTLALSPLGTPTASASPWLLFAPQPFAVTGPPVPLCLLTLVRQNSTPRDHIYVLAFGDEGLYLASGRLPAGTVYQALTWYSLLPRFRHDVSTLIMRRAPRLVVLTTRTDEPYTVDMKTRQFLVQQLRGANYRVRGACAQARVWQRS